MAAIAIGTGQQLYGLVAPEALIAAGDDTRLGHVMMTDPPVVHITADQEIAAWLAVQHGEATLAVIDKGRFVGLVPPHRLLAVLFDEHEEDLARLAGSLHDVAVARRASTESVLRRYLHRIPWLLLGLAGAALSAILVDSFEVQLAQTVVLAFFLPGVVYIADAVGTQTETVVIRGMSLGIALRATLRRETATGLMVGVTLAVLAVPLALWYGVEVAVTVAISILVACSAASVVAIALPWLLRRFGLDPAFGSGPLATVVQDLLSIAAYFWVAALVVT